jgi:hypothetical protein
VTSIDRHCGCFDLHGTCCGGDEIGLETASAKGSNCPAEVRRWDRRRSLQNHFGEDACRRELEQLSILFLVVEPVLGPRAHLDLSLSFQAGNMAGMVDIPRYNCGRNHHEVCSWDQRSCVLLPTAVVVESTSLPQVVYRTEVLMVPARVRR